MRLWVLLAILAGFIAISSNAQISYRLSLSTRVSSGADSLYVSLFAFRTTSSTSFAFGSSNLLFDFDTNSLNINRFGILNQGAWSNDISSGGNPLFYLNMLLGRGAQSNFLNLQIRQAGNTTLAGTVLPDNQQTLIARFWVGIKNCRATNTFRWKTLAPPTGAITNYQNLDIRSFATFQNPTAGPLHVPLLTPAPIFSLSQNSISFSWLGQPAAAGYRISLNRGQSWRNIGLSLSFDTLGLSGADSVSLLVEAISSCDTARSVLVIARLSGCLVFPNAPKAALDTSRCGFGRFVLKASGSGFQYRWYRASAGLLINRRSDTLSIDLNTAIDTFYVSSINALGCESQNRTRMIVRANTLPAAPIIVFKDSVCSGTAFEIIATGAQQNQTIGWQFPNGFRVINSNLDSSRVRVIANIAGNFTLAASLKNGACKSTTQNSLVVLAGSGLQIIASPIDSGATNTPITFGTAINFSSYFWDFGDGQFSSLSNPTHQYQTKGTYNIKLKVTQKNGRCPDSAIINYKVVEPSLIYVPNVFAPAAQIIENQTLKVYGANVSEQNFVFKIYNRWGVLIWQTNSFLQANQTGWDGRYQSTILQNYSIFTYILKGTFDNGTRFDKTGTIMLIN